MSQREFNDLLSNLSSLSPEQLATLRRELDSTIASAQPVRTKRAGRQAGELAGETAFDVASRAGLIGCIKGAPGLVTDLSTNPKHMEGFGSE
jgi:hypothetical protein